MVVAFLLLFLASGVGIIYFYFQNMALGLEIEKLESSVADLTADLARKTTAISDKDAKILELSEQLRELQNQATTVSVTPADLGFAFSANGRRVYGDWVITKSEWNAGASHEISGATNGMTKFNVGATYGVQDRGGGTIDIKDWKKENGKYFVFFKEGWVAIPASAVVEELAITGGVALIIRGTGAAGGFEGSDLLPPVDMLHAMVRNDKPGATYKVLHFTPPEGAGIGGADFRAFVQSISLQ